jgi:lysophospholipase L1-like esterase
MVLRCRKADAEVILCTLLPIIPEPYYTRHPKEFYDAEGGLEEILHRYHAAAMEVGTELEFPVVDLYKTFEEDLTLLRPAPDGVHPRAEGAKVIAQEIAKLLSTERKPVPLEKVRKETANKR